MSNIPTEELKIEIWPPQNTGGQHVGRTSQGIKITHLPSDMIAISVIGRSQHTNKQIAMDMIEAGITNPNFR